jgi:hypothetical protein
MMKKQTDDQIVELMIIKAIKTLSHPQRLQFFDTGLSFIYYEPAAFTSPRVLLSHSPE